MPDAFRFRFSYGMEQIYSVTVSSAVRKFLLTVAHLCSNEHDWRHRPGSSKTVSLLLGYNNNVMSGGRDMIYYVTLYNTKQVKKKKHSLF